MSTSLNTGWHLREDKRRERLLCRAVLGTNERTAEL